MPWQALPFGLGMESKKEEPKAEPGALSLPSHRPPSHKRPSQRIFTSSGCFVVDRLRLESLWRSLCCGRPRRWQRVAGHAWHAQKGGKHCVVSRLSPGKKQG